MAEPNIANDYVDQAFLIGAALLDVIDEQMPLLTSADDLIRAGIKRHDQV